MKKLLLFLLLAGVAAVIVWGVLRKSEPPKVSFVRVKRQTLVSTLPTNGKVEPAEWQAVRAETGGIVSRAPVQDGQSVAAGAVMAEITDPSLQADIDAAQAKLNEARANLATQEAGGKPADFTDIDNNLARAQFDLAQAQKVYASLERLVAQHAATQQEADAARDKVQQCELEIAGLQKRKRSLVSSTEVAAARARVGDAETALNLARQRAALSAGARTDRGRGLRARGAAGILRERGRPDRECGAHGPPAASASTWTSRNSAASPSDSP